MYIIKQAPILILIILITSIEHINADKYDEEADIDLKYKDTKSRQRRTAENYTKENVTDAEETPRDNITEECVGQKEFCNLSREEYVSMLNDYIYPQTYEWILIGTHTLVFITGLVGNALVCVAVYRNHSMRTVTNYFIVNLAAADFMVILFCLPATVLWDVTETWFLGDVLCKMLLYFQSVSVTVSVLTLTFISVDRWYAICFPLKFKSTTGRAKTAILVIWSLALIFNAPELVVLTTEKSVPLRFELEYLVQCIATWSLNSDLAWHIIKVIFIYTLPLVLMTVAYHQIVKVLWRSEKIPGQAETIKLTPAEQTQLRSRRKAAKMLVAVVIMFAVCYFPVHLLSVLRYTLDMEQTDVITCLALISHVMCYANSAINPLIYNFMSGKFRREFRRAFCCSTASDLENFTTLSRITTSKKRPCDIMTFETKAQGRNVCSTTFVQNSFKNRMLTIEVVKENETQYKFHLLALSLDIHFIASSIGFTVMFILDVVYRNNNVLLILKIQTIYSSIDISNSVRSFIIWNWISTTAIIFIHTVLNILYLGSFPFHIGLIIEHIYELKCIAWDINFVIAIRIIVLLRKCLDKWIQEILMMTDEHDNDLQCLKLLGIYENIMKIYSLCKKVFQLLIFYYTLFAFQRALCYVNFTIIFVTAESAEVEIGALLRSICLILFLAKDLGLVIIISICCEKFYISVEDAETACIQLIKIRNHSSNQRHLCKGVLQINRLFSKMTACGLFYVDATLPIYLIGLIAHYVIIQLQFFFL